MKALKKIFNGYVHFIVKHPYIVILIGLIITAGALKFAGNIETKSMDIEDMMPADMEEILAFNVIVDEFGGSDSAMIVLELDSNYLKSDEPRDIRDSDIIAYDKLLSEQLILNEDVTSVMSVSSILISMNGGILPKDENEFLKTLEHPAFDRFISPNFDIMIIRIILADDYDENDIIVELKKILDETPLPAGVKAQVGGSTLEGAAVMPLLAEDMGKTSIWSMVGIVAVLLVLFRSIRYGITPLLTIGVGVLWAFGMIGMFGMKMSSATSGVISMIMGIGIDFGIQTVMRFRDEMNLHGVEDAMQITMNSIFMPMTTTTIAALIGFRAMSMGQLTMMAEMGNMMSFGVGACYLVAITIIPAILIVGERLLGRSKIHDIVEKVT